MKALQSVIKGAPKQVIWLHVLERWEGEWRKIWFTGVTTMLRFLEARNWDFPGLVIVWEETSPLNRTETILGPEHPAKQQHVDADSIAVVNSDMSFAIILDQT
jgi:hypothetical protein